LKEEETAKIAKENPQRTQRELESVTFTNSLNIFNCLSVLCVPFFAFFAFTFFAQGISLKKFEINYHLPKRTAIGLSVVVNIFDK